MPRLRLYVDSHGYHRAESEGRFQQLAHFLDGDVQGNRDACREYLTDVRRVRSGEAQKLEGDGNGMTAIVTTHGVTLEHLYLDDVLHLTLDQYETALRGWLEFLESDDTERNVEI